MKIMDRQSTYPVRGWTVLAVVTMSFMLLIARAAWLQLVKSEELDAKGQVAYSQNLKTAAKRGTILDRNGELLAVSTRVKSVWVDPRLLAKSPDKWEKLADVLGFERERIQSIVDKNRTKAFAYLRRHIARHEAVGIKDLQIPGVGLMNEYRRYYPVGSVISHVVGWTNIDDKGQEGLELELNKHLIGADGLQKVRRNRRGVVVESVERVSRVRDGSDINLSIDARIQYTAAAQLAGAVQEHEAVGGSVVILDVGTGEVVAMANWPHFNPNNRPDFIKRSARNQAVIDVFEPGSTMKPFAIAAALESTHLTTNTLVDTGEGSAKLGRYTIRDTKPHGLLTVAEVVIKSSNVGIARVALATDPRAQVDVVNRFGFGQRSGIEFPGEQVGRVGDGRWGRVQRASLSYGYGLDVTAVQLARAYAAIANDGVAMPVTLLKRGADVPAGTRVLGSGISQSLIRMLEAAVGEEGTGAKARVPLYRVAGKTGTARKAGAGGYQKGKYRSLFAGFAPVSNPRLAMVVVIDEPSGKHFYGGTVAGPVFSRVMGSALRLLNVAPDDVVTDPQTLLASHASSLPSAQLPPSSVSGVDQ